MDLQQLFQKETTLMLGTANFNQINIDYILRIFEYNNKFQIIKKHFTVYNISVSPNLSFNIMHVIWYCYTLLILTV